jgi:hypothetical protein
MIFSIAARCAVVIVITGGAIGIGLTSCSSPLADGGGCAITLDLSSFWDHTPQAYAAPAGQSRAVSAPFDHFMLYLKGPGPDQTYRMELAQTTIIVQVIAGMWTVRVDACLADGTVVGTGAGSTEIGPDRPNALEIQMNDVPGNSADGSPTS